MKWRLAPLGWALAAFVGLGAIGQPVRAEIVCRSKQEARAATPGGYLYWRGQRGKQCWFTKDKIRRVRTSPQFYPQSHTHVSLTGQKPINRPGSINERPVTVTGQSEIAQVEAKSAHNLRDMHPGNTPDAPPGNIMAHPTWAWAEMARQNHISLDPPPGEKGGLAQAVLREHDLPGTIVYSSFEGRTEPEVWPVLSWADRWLPWR